MPGISNRQSDAAEQEKTFSGPTRVQPSKRKREGDDQRLHGQAKAQRRQSVVSEEAEKADRPAGKLVLPPILTRAESVAGDNGTPKGGVNPLPPTGEHYLNFIQ